MNPPTSRGKESRLEACSYKRGFERHRITARLRSRVVQDGQLGALLRKLMVPPSRGKELQEFEVGGIGSPEYSERHSPFVVN